MHEVNVIKQIDIVRPNKKKITLRIVKYIYKDAIFGDECIIRVEKKVKFLWWYWYSCLKTYAAIDKNTLNIQIFNATAYLNKLKSQLDNG